MENPESSRSRRRPVTRRTRARAHSQRTSDAADDFEEVDEEVRHGAPYNSETGTKGTVTSSCEVRLRKLLEFLRPFYGDPSRIDSFVEDCWYHIEKDWECITSLLLNENPPIEPTDAGNLARLLFASVRKAVGENILPASDNKRPPTDRQTVEDHKEDITNAMIKNYPGLMRKFMDDKAILPLLVEIMVYMNLSLYSSKQQEESFEDTLKLIKDAFFKHDEKDVLRSCVKAINFCSTEAPEDLQYIARSVLRDLETKLVNELQSGIKAADGDFMLENLKRLYQLQLSRHVDVEKLYDGFRYALGRFEKVDAEVVSFLLVNMHLHIIWLLESSSDKEASASLVSKCGTLFSEYEYFILTAEENLPGPRGIQLACKVFIMLADASSWSWKRVFPKKLGYCPDEYLLRKIWKLCEKRLNISDERESNEENVVMMAAERFATEVVSKVRTHYINTGEDGWRPYHTFLEKLKKHAGLKGFRDENKGNTAKHRVHPRNQNEESKDYGARLRMDRKKSFLTVIILALRRIKFFRQELISMSKEHSHNDKESCVACSLSQIIEADSTGSQAVNLSPLIQSICNLDSLGNPFAYSTAIHNLNPDSSPSDNLGTWDDSSKVLNYILNLIHASSANVSEEDTAEVGYLECTNTTCVDHGFFGAATSVSFYCHPCHEPRPERMHAAFSDSLHIQDFREFGSRRNSLSELLERLWEVRRVMVCRHCHIGCCAKAAEGGYGQFLHIGLHWGVLKPNVNIFVKIWKRLTQMVVSNHHSEPREKYSLVSVICYDRLLERYICLAYDGEKGGWVLFDGDAEEPIDVCIKVETMRRCWPAALFFEAIE